MRLLSFALLAACHAPANGGPGPDAGAPSDSGVIDTTPNQWVWVEIPGSTCANGTPAGFGINRAASGNDLFVYFQGGGACWDANTCFVLKTAINTTTTYGPANLATDVAVLEIDRSWNAALANANLVFVPYCTADLHAGTNVKDYMVAGQMPIHHTGGTNTQLFVDALHATFPDAANVWVSGSSAGGYGATLNFLRFADAWPTAKLSLLEDSSPFIPVYANYGSWQSAWNLAFPTGCADCASDLTAAFDTIVAAEPDSRVGLLTWDDDATITAYFGYTGPIDEAQSALIAGHFDHARTHAFELAGTNHTMLGQLATLAQPSGGITLDAWVTQWLTGDDAWATVGN